MYAGWPRDLCRGVVYLQSILVRPVDTAHTPHGPEGDGLPSANIRHLHPHHDCSCKEIV
jgi:hypothetical protein